MKKPLAAAALAAASIVAPLEMAASQIQTHDLGRKIWRLLDDAKAPFVELSEDDCRALGVDLTLPMPARPSQHSRRRRQKARSIRPRRTMGTWNCRGNSRPLIPAWCAGSYGRSEVHVTVRAG